MNVQVACTITGCLAWISDPIPGGRHDNHCLGESGVLLSADPHDWLGDKGYIGNNMLTPFRKPEGGELLDWQKEFNMQINKIRYVIEQVIANFKTWWIMHTDYRRPLVGRDVEDTLTGWTSMARQKSSPTMTCPARPGRSRRETT
jgi:hypothetical protein